MEFRDLKQQYRRLQSDIDRAMAQVAASGAFIMGEPVNILEQQLAQYVGVKHCISCANGTDALTLALKALGIGKGDVVFVPDFTFFASAEVVAEEGATPVFVDVDPATFNIDPHSLQNAIEAVRNDLSLHPRAIIAVDLFGLPANFEALRPIAKQYGLHIIEDGAQGFGGIIKSTGSAHSSPKLGEVAQRAGGVCQPVHKRACGYGDIATTSFFPAKPLGCYGDGGAVFTDNDEWAATLRSLRVHGKGSNKYDNVRIGMNSRLDTLQAAILQVKLKAFAEYELADVNRAADYYTQLIQGTTRFSRKEVQIIPPTVPKGYTSSWAQYTVRLEVPSDNGTVNRDALQAKLKAKGIPSMVYYPIPMSRQKAFSHCHSFVLTPNAERLSHSVLSLPMHPYLTREEIRTVVEALVTSI